jgi:hypothetical protein
MKNFSLLILAAAIIAGGSIGVPTKVEARCKGCAVGAGIAAGVVGGLIIGDAIANSRREREYYDDERRRRVEYDDDEIEYCMRRFKSYDPDSGTYMGYDGVRHPCP